MQKKILVAAIAVFAAAPVFADLTIYGTADVGFEYVDLGLDADGNSKSVSHFTSGILNPSVLGIKGEQKLSNGLKAGFQLESGFIFERGLLLDSSSNINQTVYIPGATRNPLWNRIARVYLATKYGEFSFGRQYSPIAYVECNLEPTCGGLGFTVDNYWSIPDRLDNSVKFTTLNRGGFMAQFSYSAGDQNMTKNDFVDPVKPVSGGVSYGASAQYANGPVYVGFGYDQLYSSMTAPNFFRPVRSVGYVFGASYSLSKVKTFASFRNYRTVLFPAVNFEVDGYKRNIFTIGASVLIGRGTLVTNFSFLSDKTDYASLAKLGINGDTSDSHLFGLAYLYQLSKDITVYLSGSKMSNDINGSHSAYTINTASLPGPMPPVLGNNLSEIAFGVRYNF
ncbi:MULTISPECIES: porin [Candidatus Ichthyocystis]|uniref:Outer membrane protein (Porin) n=1 Tax=Candidatus Ichthyocystis hellenicum TaxID=1561003 RepID=A0A0S4M2J0_9BURK|nr:MULTISPECIES: porin [Ichthyocystis]CUT17483.1 outer membrane protein (porin) [Candidatus Ichthyocystis hellenicum]